MSEYVQHHREEPAVAGDAVKRRYENRADLAVLAIAKETLERRPLGSHPARALVDIQLSDNDTAVFRQLPQHLLLFINRRRATLGDGRRPAVASYYLIFFHIPQGMTQTLQGVQSVVRASGVGNSHLKICSKELSSVLVA